MTDVFKVFTNRVRSCLQGSSDPHECAEHVATHLKELLKHPDFLEEQYTRVGEDEPKAHLMYVAPEKNFSVVSFVWKPGQQTCIHDHVCWCVVGVLKGQEEEAGFKLLKNQDETWLYPTGRHSIEPGHVCKLVPPDEDIHQVSNSGNDVAISIHVYGTDIGERGTSINRRFDLPIIDNPNGEPLVWRDDPVGQNTGIQLS